MKSRNKKLLWQSSIIIFCFFCFFLFLGFSIDTLTNKLSNNITVVMIFILLFVLSYSVASFVLFRLFKTNNLLDKLLKNTLHELNVPLSTIKANAQLLKTNISKDNIKRVDRILKSSEHLYRLYEEVEYYIKKEAVLIKHEVFDAKDVVFECIEQIKTINTTISLSKNLNSTYIKADKIGFYKIVLNLLLNAYKYNKPNGKVEVILHNGKLHVNDTGIGMSEEARFKLFDRYYQENENSEGYGIGLNIVKSYCDEHKIFISLVTEERVGTKVTLNLEHLIN